MKNLSFVVQGKIQPNTKNCLLSIRQFYPASCVILSTWECDVVEGLSYDTLVRSKDPGAVEFAPGFFYNLNRQIISSAAGLNKVGTDLAVKMRTDTQIIDRKLEKIASSQPFGHFFEHRIAALDLFFRDPRAYPLLFHIGDIFHCGKTSDLLNLWTIPLAPEPETSMWSARRFDILNDRKSYLPRYAPEQYIFIAFLNKLGYSVSLDYWCQTTEEDAIFSEQAIARNFSIYTMEELGLHVPSRLAIHGDAASIYTASFLSSVASKGVQIQEIKNYVRSRRLRLLRKFLKSPTDWRRAMEYWWVTRRLR